MRRWRSNETLPFGETWVTDSSASNPTPYRFTGRERDEETGLTYVGARYYEAKTAQWMSADPALAEYMVGGGVGNLMNLSLYTFAWNSPISFGDPDGRQARPRNAGAGTDGGSTNGGPREGQWCSATWIRDCIPRPTPRPTTQPTPPTPPQPGASPGATQDPDVVLNGIHLNNFAQQGDELTCLNFSMILGAMSVHARTPGLRPRQAFDRVAANLYVYLRAYGDSKLPWFRDHTREASEILRRSIAGHTTPADVQWVARTHRQLFRTWHNPTPAENLDRSLRILTTDDAPFVPRQVANNEQFRNELCTNLRQGSFAQAVGRIGPGGRDRHAIAIIGIGDQWVWHDSRDPESGQRRTFQAPSVPELLDQVETAVQRGEYDFRPEFHDSQPLRFYHSPQ